MADGVTFTWDATRLLAAMDALAATVQKAEVEACRITAQNIATEARARVARRGPNPTRAQQGRPPLEDLIRVEPLANGTGYAVIVQEPAGSDAVYLPFYLEMGTKEMDRRPFFFTSAALERPAHLLRINAAAQAAIDTLSS